MSHTTRPALRCIDCGDPVQRDRYGLPHLRILPVLAQAGPAGGEGVVTRPELISAIYQTIASRRGLPRRMGYDGHSWGSSLNADLGRLELRREFRRAGLGTPELRERWIREIT